MLILPPTRPLNAQRESAEGTELIDVEFVFGNPKETDYGMVRSLLRRYVDDEKLDKNALADIICEQVRGLCCYIVFYSSASSSRYSFSLYVSHIDPSAFGIPVRSGEHRAHRRGWGGERRGLGAGLNYDY